MEPDPGHPYDPHAEASICAELRLGACNPSVPFGNCHRHGDSVHPSGGGAGAYRASGDLFCVSCSDRAGVYGACDRNEEDLYPQIWGVARINL